jgi:hypothetical protein
MWRNSHFHPATRNAFFIILYSIVRWRLGVAKHLERFPQKTRKTIPMQSIGMSVSCGILKEPWKLGHLKHGFKW